MLDVESAGGRMRFHVMWQDTWALISAKGLSRLREAEIKNLRLFLKRCLSEILVPGAVVYMREPVGIRERLTLKDFFSEELNHDYHTIYRTAEEYRLMMEENAPAFSILQSGFLFDSPGLNNRKETSQYYYLLKRKR